MKKYNIVYVNEAEYYTEIVDSFDNENEAKEYVYNANELLGNDASHYEYVCEEEIKVVCGTGHRPSSLPKEYGYDYHSQAWTDVINRTIQFLIDNKVNKVISGMALGFDQVLAIAVYKMKTQLNIKIELEAAVPCINQSCKWADSSKRLYLALLKNCDKVTIISNEYTDTCMQDRNEYMVNNSDIVLAFWNGKSGGTKNCVEYAEKNNKRIINIWKEPKVLYCDSKGDKRFSALYAVVKINKITDTIENLYQNAKRDSNGNIPGKGNPVDHIIWNGKQYKAEKLSVLYESLWRLYFKQNPDLLEYAKQFDTFIDRFKGKSINCQADVIEKLVKETKETK